MALTRKEIGRRYRLRNPKKSNATWQKYAATEKGVMTLLLNNAADRARRKGVAFDLTREWLAPKLRNGECELSGIKFERGVRGPYKAHPFGPSIDKIDPRGPYTQQNCRLVAFCVNMARSDWGDVVLLEMATGIVKNLA